MINYKLILKDPSFEDAAWDEVLKAGGTPLYSESEEGKVILYIDQSESIPEYSWAEIEKTELSEIDWHEQWALHAPGFNDGLLKLAIDDTIAVQLKPGTGFGDLSHPTTRLMLKALKDYVVGKDVVDIGCGSGILSFATAALGAKSVLGIDIDQGAVDHAIENLAFNSFAVMPTFKHSLNDQFEIQSHSIALMNMIASEQRQALGSMKQEHSKFSTLITSGILLQDAKSYVRELESNGWRLFEMFEEDNWCVFIFFL